MAGGADCNEPFRIVHSRLAVMDMKAAGRLPCPARPAPTVALENRIAVAAETRPGVGPPSLLRPAHGAPAVALAVGCGATARVRERSWDEAIDAELAEALIEGNQLGVARDGVRGQIAVAP